MLDYSFAAAQGPRRGSERPGSLLAGMIHPGVISDG